MATMSFDPEDTALIAFVALASGVMAGLASFAAFGVSLSDTTTFAGGTFSLAYLGTVGAYLATVVTNEGLSLDPSALNNRAKKDLDDTYYYVLMGSLGLLLAWPFVSGISSFIQSQDLWGVLYIAFATGSQVAIGYIK